MHLISRAAVCSAHHDLHVSVSRTAVGMGSSTFVGELRLSASHPSHPLHWGKAHLTSIRAVCAGHHGLQLPPIESGEASVVGSSTMVGALRSSESHPSHPLHWGKAHLTSIRAVCAGHHGLHTWSFPASWPKPTLDVGVGQGHDAAQFECINTGICSHSP